MYEVTWRTLSSVQGRESSRPFFAIGECRQDCRHSRLDSLRHDTGIEEVEGFSHV